MVSNKSIHHGRYDGFQSSFVPNAPRSLRMDSNKRSSEGSELYAFELLAEVAEQLLQESESSTSIIGQEQKEQITFPIVKQEEPEDRVKVKDVKSDHFDQGSCAESESDLKLKLDLPMMESPESDNVLGLKHVSDDKSFKKIGNSVKLELPDEKIVADVLSKPISGVNLPFYKNSVSCIPKHRGNVKMGITDDDDNLFRYNHRGARMRAFRSRSHAGYRRIRKILTSRYRKVTPTKDYELTNPTKIGQLEAAAKRRKLFHQNLKTSYAKSGNENKTSNKVKFSIKSFKVPELYIEIPETATIGSLKRTVTEAVRTFLGGKLHVGMHLEGKKVKDNSRTLKQTGIPLKRDLNTLGLTLEPSFSHDTSQQPSRRTASPRMDVGFSKCSLDHPSETSFDKCVDKNQEIILLESEVLTEEKVVESNALVPAAVPINNKPIKKPEATQCRRIRRPFSVTEVEALVEAVEALGTGRWRDVKMRAFDDADHRTYVDLKDKWKTLVHTASISPQQRRGEPVPQDLLDRVLAADGYWSNHLVKQRKHQTEPLRILGGPSVEFVGI